MGLWLLQRRPGSGIREGGEVYVACSPPLMCRVRWFLREAALAARCFFRGVGRIVVSSLGNRILECGKRGTKISSALATARWFWENPPMLRCIGLKSRRSCCIILVPSPKGATYRSHTGRRASAKHVCADADTDSYGKHLAGSRR